MSTQTNIVKDEQSVLNFIKENLSNNAFVEKIKNLLASDSNIDVPEWQQKEVLNRLEDYRKNPNDVLDWEDVKSELLAR